MRFYILGLGPIGSLVAHHLRTVLPREHAVTLIHKSRKQASVARERGGIITVERDGVSSVSGGYNAEVFEPRGHVGQVVPTSADKIIVNDDTPTQEEKRSENIQMLFITTKAHSTAGAVQRMLPRLSAHSTIVLLQNGMGVYEHLIQNVFRNPNDRPHFILGSNTHGAWLKGFYHVVHSGVGEIEFGIAPDVRNRNFEASLADESVPKHDRVLQLDDITTPSDVEHERYRSLRQTVTVLRSLPTLNAKWKPMSEIQISMRRKLVVNSVINPLTAIMGCRNGELFQDNSSRYIMHQVCKEASDVFKTQIQTDTQCWLDGLGSDIDQDSIPLGRYPSALRRTRLISEVLRVARVTGGNMSSTLSDVRRGRETELDYMNGYLMNLGAQYDVPVPITAALYHLAKARCAIPLDQQF